MAYRVLWSRESIPRHTNRQTGDQSFFDALVMYIYVVYISFLGYSLTSKPEYLSH